MNTQEHFRASATAKSAQLREGTFPRNEETTKVRLILPILRSLGWNDESDEVEFEAGIGQRDAADFALRANDERRVLIEAKKGEEALRPDHEDQIGKYASRDNADLAILTNGRQWWCYLVRASGSWNDRRFAELDLLNNLHEFVEVMWNVLRREAFAGEKSPAILAAQDYLAKRQDLDRADQVLPNAWREMLDEPDPELVRVLANRANVASEDAVLEFLRGIADDTGLASSRRQALHDDGGVVEGVAEDPGPASSSRGSDLPPRKARLRDASLCGKPLAVHKWVDLLFEVAKHVVSTGRLRLPWQRPNKGKRIVLSKRLSDLNKEIYGLELPGGYWLDRWWNSSACLEIARELLDAAGIGRHKLRVEW